MLLDVGFAAFDKLILFDDSNQNFVILHKLF